MKTRIVVTLLAATLLGLAGTAQAGDRHGFRAGGHYRGYATHHYRPASHYGGHYYAPRYRNAYGYVYYRPYPHHRHYRGVRLVAGAVLLGSIIHAANYDRPSRVVYVDRTPVTVRAGAASGQTWYETDSGGDCFEVRPDSAGNEVWTLTDPAYCR
jgi:hypothetical protein